MGKEAERFKRIWRDANELLLETTSGTFDLNTRFLCHSENLPLCPPWQVVAESCDECKRVDRVADILLSIPDSNKNAIQGQLLRRVIIYRVADILLGVPDNNKNAIPQQ